MLPVPSCCPYSCAPYLAGEQPNLYQYRFQKKKLNSSISARESDARRSGKQRDLGRLGKAHMPSLCQLPSKQSGSDNAVVSIASYVRTFGSFGQSLAAYLSNMLFDLSIVVLVPVVLV